MVRHRPGQAARHLFLDVLPGPGSVSAQLAPLRRQLARIAGAEVEAPRTGFALSCSWSVVSLEHSGQSEFGGPTLHQIGITRNPLTVVASFAEIRVMASNPVVSRSD